MGAMPPRLLLAEMYTFPLSFAAAVRLATESLANRCSHSCTSGLLLAAVVVAVGAAVATDVTDLDGAWTPVAVLELAEVSPPLPEHPTSTRARANANSGPVLCAGLPLNPKLDFFISSHTSNGYP